MTSTRLWDRAAALPALPDGRRRPQVAVLPAGLPTLAELFDFMRDAELRFATLRCASRSATRTARGEERDLDGGRAPPPGRRQGHDHPRWSTARSATTRSGSRTASSSGRTRASTSSGRSDPIRNRPRGLADPDFPGSSQVYEPVTALPIETLPDTFVHPAGYCQNVLATGRCR